MGAPQRRIVLLFGVALFVAHIESSTSSEFSFGDTEDAWLRQLISKRDVGSSNPPEDDHLRIPPPEEDDETLLHKNHIDDSKQTVLPKSNGHHHHHHNHEKDQKKWSSKVSVTEEPQHSGDRVEEVPVSGFDSDLFLADEGKSETLPQPDAKLLDADASGNADLGSGDDTEDTELPSASGNDDFLISEPSPREPKTLGVPCDQAQCSPDLRDLRVTLNSLSGWTVAEKINVSLVCSVYLNYNGAVSLSWHLPRGEYGSVDIMDQDTWTRIAVEEHRYNETNGARLVLGTLHIQNVTSADAGAYSCRAVFSERYCCVKTITQQLGIYTPPSYATDLFVVSSVCFVEFVIILYLKTKGNKRNSTQNPEKSSKYQQMKEYKLVRSADEDQA